MKGEKAKHIEEVSKEIIQMKFKNSMTIDQLIKRFHSIMRKHGIKKGTKTKGGGVQMANFEWTICWTMFLNRIESHFQWSDMFDCPKDLHHY